MNDDEIQQIAKGVSVSHRNGLSYVARRSFSVGAYHSPEQYQRLFDVKKEEIEEWKNEIRDRFGCVEFTTRWMGIGSMIVVDAWFPCILGGEEVDDRRYPPVIEQKGDQQ